MADAPERIWLDWPAANKGDVVYDEPPERDTQPGQTEYVRADLVDILRADRDSAVRMWQASEQEREAAVERAKKASQYLAIETQHAVQAEARADIHAAALAEVERLRWALSSIAKQKRTNELATEYDVECADFEGGYDACIDCARAALEAKP